MFQTTLIRIPRFGFSDFELYLTVRLFRVSCFGPRGRFRGFPFFLSFQNKSDRAVVHQSNTHMRLELAVGDIETVATKTL